MNRIMKSKELKVYYGEAVFSLSRFHFLHFLQCGAISNIFYNNEHIITSSLLSGVTHMGICFFKRRSIKIIKAQERNSIECVSLIFST